MSTKIWVAYKLKDPNNLWQFIMDVREKAIKNVEEKLVEFEAKLIPDINENSEEYNKLLELYKDQTNPTEKARQMMVEKMMSTEYRKSASSTYREIFDFDVYITFYELDGQIYLIPRADMLMRGALDFLDDHDQLEDFHYQNQTDPPEDIPEEEYEARGKIWNKIYKNNMWNSLKLDILCVDNYYLHSPSTQRFNEAWNKKWKDEFGDEKA